MNRLRLAAAALNQTPLAWDANRRHIVAAIDAARDAGVGVLCLPELCLSGYGCEDMFLSTGVQRTAMEMLLGCLPESRGLAVSFGLPVFFEGAVFNCAALACDGRLLGIVAKQHLAGDGIHYEPRWFRRWPAGVAGAIEIAGESVPIGDLLFDCGGVRIGFEICRDAWVAGRTGARLAQRGADILLNPSASHFAFAKQEIRERFVLEGSRAFCVSYAYANLLGNEAGRAIYDGGTLVASNGKMLVSGPRFSYADWVLTTALVDVTATRRARSAFFAEPGDAPRATDDDQLVAIDFTLPLDDGEATICSFTVPGHPQWETDKNQKEEEFARAVPLALFDYLRKSHARGLCVSLSGGADSSAVAVMVWLMAKFATGELGIDTATNKLHLAHLKAPTSAPSRKDGADARAGELGGERGVTPAPPLRDGANGHFVQLLVRRLLTCVYQATCNSGEVTLNAARSVAEAIGAEFVEWDVDRIVTDYAQTVSEAIGRPLSWETDDVALQNIQARARGPGIWLMANLRGALLLTTSNRSEAAVGYATMDGDTCGGQWSAARRPLRHARIDQGPREYRLETRGSPT